MDFDLSARLRLCLSRSMLLLQLRACPGLERAAGLQPGHARRSLSSLRSGEMRSCQRIFLRGIQVNRAGKPNATCAVFGLFADI